jgi:hypothetical protein
VKKKKNEPGTTVIKEQKTQRNRRGERIEN